MARLTRFEATFIAYTIAYANYGFGAHVPSLGAGSRDSSRRFSQDFDNAKSPETVFTFLG